MSPEYIYDGSFNGFLTAVFDVYKNKEQPNAILRFDATNLHFSAIYEIITDIEKAERVWNGIIKTGGEETGKQIYYTFLSCEKDMEILLLQYIRHLFETKQSVMYDLANPVVLKVHKLSRKVGREAHRVLMFLRFEQAVDGTYFAPFAPKYDIISLTLQHFKARFNSQQWLIYDTIRDYGFYYNTKTIEQVVVKKPGFVRQTGKLSKNAKNSEDEKWQKLWQRYFKTMAIAERKNLELQRNFMPKKFWKYLTEKQHI
jgi:probable DNA metabolism protein